MKEEAGRSFASLLATELNCRVAGYTQYIHVLQRGLMTASPNKPTDWSDEAAAGGRVWFYEFSPTRLALLWGAGSDSESVSTWWSPAERREGDSPASTCAPLASVVQEREGSNLRLPSVPWALVSYPL